MSVAEIYCKNGSTKITVNQYSIHPWFNNKHMYTVHYEIYQMHNGLTYTEAQSTEKQSI